MKEIIIDCISVTEVDGMGMSDHHIAYCATQEVADQLVKRQKGWRKAVPFKQVFTIVDTVDEYDAITNDALRKSALAKLTESEKRALGF